MAVDSPSGAVAAPSASSLASHDELLKIESARATELLGYEVRNERNEPVAKIEDFLIDLENGRIVQVIVAGDEATKGHYEVPPRTFTGYAKSERVLRWRGDQTKFSQAPQFSPPGSNRPGQAVHAAEVYRYYDEDPYFIIGEAEPRTPNNVHTHGQVDTPAKPRVPLGRVVLASQLIGLEVKDATDAKAGSVEDLIIDVPAGRVVALIISSGGVLGVGESASALPPSTVSYTAGDKNELRTSVSKEVLGKAPRYKTADAGRFNDPVYTDEVYRAYQVELYSTVVAADNTRRNVRDRHNATLTPLDQSNAAPDVQISARIRKDIVARDDLSVNAKNVKIITQDGRVTLRGPVKTLGEKRVIEAIAAREAGSPAKVDNQIEVIAD